MASQRTFPAGFIGLIRLRFESGFRVYALDPKLHALHAQVDRRSEVLETVVFFSVTVGESACASRVLALLSHRHEFHLEDYKKDPE